MTTKQVIKSCIYGGLMIAFIFASIQAFDNLLAQNSGQSFKSVHENTKMPSITICPSMQDRGKFVTSGSLLEYLKDTPMNITLELDGKK